MPRDPEQISEAFVADMESCWGEDLVSVILYGSGARDDFIPGRSDLNFLVLVRDLEPERLRSLQQKVKRWRKERVAMPVLMRPEMVQTALDSYPLEFLTMKGAHRVLKGTDALAGLVFQREDVRLQCERDLRGKLLHLRAGAIECEGKRDRMAELIRSSLPAMTALFQGLLFFAGRPAAVWGNDLLEAGRDAYNLDTVLFQELSRVRFEKRPPSKEVLQGLIARYLREVERLVEMIDAGGLKPQAAGDSGSQGARI
ncbi:MAG: hypothetical protein KAY24_14210 [Candidatus Eisenbacteria sp.]|nr:hypothetical protein [Candidatus Eisenbacteria bacterium]